jgi:hydroxyethylthiazole kinase-like uncharacterized protein yjeF
MLVCTAEQMRELDRCTIEDYGVAGVVLMEVAGRAVADTICRVSDVGAGRVVIFCGGGNNGGDGFVIARHLIGRGSAVTVCLLAARERIRGDAATNLSVLQRLGADVRSACDDDQLARLDSEIRHATVIVDAMLGTGLNQPLGGIYRAAVDRLNACDALRIAVDIPTGLEADSGQVLGAAFQAHHTVTFGYPKLGLVLHPGVELVGELHVADIGIPKLLEQYKPFVARLLDGDFVRSRMPVRPPAGHKGTFGHLLVIAGSVGKSGAALLCAESAMRAGVGLCTVATLPEVLPALECKTREVMLEPLLPAGVETLDDRDATFAQLKTLLRGKSAVAIGPGIPRGTGTERFMFRLVRELESVPLLIDADGLNALAGQVELLGQQSYPIVLTPHPGEMGRLTGLAALEVQQKRVELARDFAETHAVHLALKGARTVVATPEGTIYLNPTGNSGMASGGTGDALSGIVGALLAQGCSAEYALALGVYLHGAAGDRAARRVGTCGLVASDLIDEIGPALSELARAP